MKSTSLRLIAFLSGSAGATVLVLAAWAPGWTTLFPAQYDDARVLAQKQLYATTGMYDLSTNTGLRVAFLSSIAANITNNVNLNPTNTVGISGNVNLNPTNTVGVTGNVGGYTLVTYAPLNVDTTAAGIAANDAYAPVVTIPNAVRVNNGSGILHSVTVITGDNNTNAIRLLVCGAPITWPGTNAVANLVSTELATNFQGIVTFLNTDFVQMGTNYACSKSGLGIGIHPMTNTLFLYAICGGVITNTNKCQITLTILQD